MKAKVKRNNKYVFRAVLAVWMMMAVVLTAFMPDTVRAEASETEKAYAAVYDYDYYKSHNADLQKAFGNERQSYVDHFVRCGMKEGRQGNEEFNLEVYKYNWADLRAAYKDDNVAYYKHYIKYGKAEGRNAKTKEQQKASTIYEGTDYAAVYNYEYYRKNNADLQKIFKEDSAKYLKHFVQYGMKEGRQGNEEFNLEVYKYNGADLRAAYKDDNAAYYKHYIKYGKAEGRNAKTKEQQKASTVYEGTDYAAVYNYEYYRKNNADLQKIFGEDSAKYLKHFVQYGMNEGRQGSEEFNLEVYKYNGADLCAAYKDNNAAYYKHYIKYGKAEGRNAKTKEQQKASTIYEGTDYAAVYNYEYYRKNNADLQKIFKEDSAKYLKHFVQYGMNEGRQGNDEFILYIYKSNYSDLEAAFKSNNAAYYKHYIKYGKAEGRNARTLIEDEDETVSAVFNANGGYFVKEDGSHTTVMRQQPSEMGKITFGQSPENSDPHLMFDGWYTNKECSGQRVSDYRLFIDKKVTFYAKWKPCLAVTFYGNGGYFDGDVKKTQYVSKVEAGTNFCYIPRYNNTQNDSESDAGWGWSLAGWALDPEGKQPINLYSIGEEVTKDMTIYAQWSQEKQYVVTFDTGDGHFSDGSHKRPTKVWKNSSGIYYLSEETPTIDDDTRMFEGWYTEEGDNIYHGIAIDSDTTFYAKWVPAIVITYDANGGKIECSDSIRSIKCRVGTITQYLLDTKRSGYKFTGWYFDKECTKDSYSIQLQESTTVYAGWREDKTVHSVVFDANGGYFKREFPSSDPESIIKEYVVNETEGVSKYVQPISKDGLMAFDGWYLDPECTKEVEYLDQDRIKITEDTRLYAKWVPGYVVTFDGNGVKFDQYFYYAVWYPVERFYYSSVSYVVKPGDKIYEYEMDMTGAPEYTFCGWYLDPECTEPVDFDKPITSNVTYYASWHRSTEITYDSNSDHKFSNGELTFTKEVVKGISSELDLSYTDDTGRYKVEGWYWDKECTQPVGDSFVVNAPTRLYAKWKTVNIVTFDANGGEFYNRKTTLRYSVENGKTIDYGYASPEDQLLYIQGRTFKGWSSDPDSTELISSDEIATYVINGDRVFYAVWEIRYEITYDANGGYFWDKDTTKTSQWYADGSLLKDVGTLRPSNADEHKEFAGWYFEPECINKVDEDTYAVESNVTLYAKWEDRCVITFDANGGHFWYEATTQDRKYVAGCLMDSYPQPSNSDQHLEFGGWYFEPECVNKVNIGDYVVENDVTLYAKWEKCYVITIDANGGYFWDEDTTVRIVKCIKGNPVSDAGIWTPDQADEHKSFAGWYLDAECTISIDEYKYIPEQDLTLYAKWETGCVIVFDDVDGGSFSDNKRHCVSGSLLRDINFPYWQKDDKHQKFMGWYLEPECINEVYNSYTYTINEAYKDYVVESDLTLYPKWEACYIITRDANGGYFWDDIVVNTFQSLVGKAFGNNMMMQPENKDEHKTFAGWYMEPECINCIEEPHEYIPEGDMTIYAKWEDRCIVTFDANGGYFRGDESMITYKQEYTAGSSIRMYGYPDISNSNKHLSCAGWYFEPECINEVNFDEYIVESDLTLYAKWETGCVIVFDDVDGGSFRDNKRHCVSGSLLRDINFPYWQKDDKHQKFMGWYLEPECINEVYNSYTYTINEAYKDYVVESDLTLYPKWEACYIITRDANGGYFWDDIVVNTFQSLVGKAFGNNMMMQPENKDEHKIFAGWYMEPECINCIERPHEYIPEGDMTIYAKWENIEAQALEELMPIEFDTSESDTTESEATEFEEAKAESSLEFQSQTEEKQNLELESVVESEEEISETLEEIPGTLEEIPETLEDINETLEESSEVIEETFEETAA